MKLEDKLTSPSTRLLLHEAHATLPIQTTTSAYLDSVHHIKTSTSQVRVSVAGAPEHTGHIDVVSCVKDSSPFLVTLLYRGACILERLHRENPTSESFDNMEMVKMVLGKFDTRWKSAGTCFTFEV